MFSNLRIKYFLLWPFVFSHSFQMLKHSIIVISYLPHNMLHIFKSDTTEMANTYGNWYYRGEDIIDRNWVLMKRSWADMRHCFVYTICSRPYCLSCLDRCAEGAIELPSYFSQHGPSSDTSLTPILAEIRTNRAVWLLSNPKKKH